MNQSSNYPKNIWEEKNLKKKEPKPITNAFAHNPRKVISPVKFQTGIANDEMSDLKRKALLPGKRISKTGKVYYEYRINRTDLNGKVK